MADWRIERLGKGHDKKHFDCGEPSLNEYLHKYAGQGARLGLGRTYVAVEEGERKVAGYYTLSSGSVAFAELPQDMAAMLPKYPIPVALLSRLAVDRSYQGRKLGERLLVDALRRCVNVSEELGVLAVEVHALNERARSFYVKYGFTQLQDDEMHLYLPMKTIRKAFS